MIKFKQNYNKEILFFQDTNLIYIPNYRIIDDLFFLTLNMFDIKLTNKQENKKGSIWDVN